MFLADNSKLLPLTDDWVHQSMDVFHGELTCCLRKHVGMDRCDKQYLVTPMLGLWAQLCQRKDEDRFAELHAKLVGELDKVFPATFMYQSTGYATRSKKLFGNLIAAMQQRLKDGDGAEKAMVDTEDEEEEKE